MSKEERKQHYNDISNRQLNPKHLSALNMLEDTIENLKIMKKNMSQQMALLSAEIDKIEELIRNTQYVQWIVRKHE